MPRKGSEITLSIVGLHHRGWNKNGKMVLSDAAPFPVEIRRELENEHHGNAIAVYIPNWKQKKFCDKLMLWPFRGRQLGYLRATIADVYAPLYDAEELEFIDPVLISVNERAGEASMSVRIKQ